MGTKRWLRGVAKLRMARKIYRRDNNCTDGCADSMLSTFDDARVTGDSLRVGVLDGRTGFDMAI